MKIKVRVKYRYIANHNEVMEIEIPDNETDPQAVANLKKVEKDKADEITMFG